MNRAQVAALLELIEEFVYDTNLPWPEKRKLVKNQANDRQWIAIQEFCTWFEEEAL